MVAIRIIKEHDAKIPHYSHAGDSGMDLYSVEDCIIHPMERKLIRTGIRVEIPIGYEAQIRPKSGLAINHGITHLNTPGTIDSNYRGEIKIILINLGSEPYKVEKGKKVGQIVFSKVETAVLEETEELSQTSRGDGGFGSTGLG